MAIVSGSTKGPPPSERRPAAPAPPKILAPVGIDDRVAVLPRESGRLSALVDQLAGQVVLRHATGRHVLDLGHGSPRVTQWVEPRAQRLTVVDAVDLGRGDTIQVPLPAGGYECIYSLRTLPHLGHDARSSVAAFDSVLEELARLLRPGGVAVLQLDNARSPVGLYHGVRQLSRALQSGPLVIDSPRGVTRFDTLSRVIERLPPTLTPIDLHGVRQVVASPHVLSIPVVGRIAGRLEWSLRDKTLLRRFAVHLLLVLRRMQSPRQID